ncbi:MAG: xanthine dehydrogenase family protein molybdopterin-binding subunit [Pseudomonadota bacterium]
MDGLGQTLSTRLLTGGGRYIEDEPAADALSMLVLRSPVAHGVITELDVSDARAMPGVMAVLTHADIARAAGPIRCREEIIGLDGPMVQPDRTLLADGKVVFVGQPVAVVVAETAVIARDAVEAITLDIDPLPAVFDPRLAEVTPPIWHDAPVNISFRWQRGNGADTQAMIASADHLVELEVPHPRIAIAPVETRGCLASYGPEGYCLTTPSQGVVFLRTTLATCLGIDPSELRVITHDVGGSFAVKIWPYPEQAIALIAAKQTGRPVRWIADRGEAFNGDAPGRGRIDRARLALDAEGRFMAFSIDAIADMGAFLSPAAPSIVTGGACRPFGQAYDIPGMHYQVSAVFTNAVPTDAFRGAGKPESTGTLERLIDVAAARMGIDPSELRRRNLIKPAQLPYPTPMGETVDSGDFPAVFQAAEIESDWANLHNRKAVNGRHGKLRGGAIAPLVHASGGSNAERSEVRALTDGTVLVRTGTQDSGQSHRHSLALVAARVLEIDPARVRVEQGDSAWLSKGGGTGGSNLMPVAGNTVHRTSHAMLDEARHAAAEMLEVADADLDYGAGTFRIVGTDRTATLAQVAQYMEHEGPGCVAQLDFEGDHTTWPNGVYAVEVVVDPETGVTVLDRFVGVTDVGQVINGPAATGQVHGGVGQAIGEALMEGMIFDDDGQPLNASFMDYQMPRAADLPMMGHGWVHTDAPTSLIGAKGVGELASIGAPGIIANAVLDALRPLGVEHLDMPLTPLKIWQAIQTVAR